MKPRPLLASKELRETQAARIITGVISSFGVSRFPLSDSEVFFSLCI